MKKLKVAILKDCLRCKNLKTYMDNNNIQYVEIDCTYENKFCDDLDSMCLSSNYPKIIMLDDNNIENIVYITDYMDEYNKQKNQYGKILHPVLTLQDIIRKL